MKYIDIEYIRCIDMYKNILLYIYIYIYIYILYIYIYIHGTYCIFRPLYLRID